jgi:hypothetical protein
VALVAVEDQDFKVVLLDPEDKEILQIQHPIKEMMAAKVITQTLAVQTILTVVAAVAAANKDKQV